MLEGRVMLRAYFDARFLTIFAVLLVISVALGRLNEGVDLNALHTSQKMVMVRRTWFNSVVSRAIQ